MHTNQRYVFNVEGKRFTTTRGISPYLFFKNHVLEACNPTIGALVTVNNPFLNYFPDLHTGSGCCLKFERVNGDGLYLLFDDKTLLHTKEVIKNHYNSFVISHQLNLLKALTNNTSGMTRNPIVHPKGAHFSWNLHMDGNDLMYLYCFTIGKQRVLFYQNVNHWTRHIPGILGKIDSFPDFQYKAICSFQSSFKKMLYDLRKLHNQKGKLSEELNTYLNENLTGSNRLYFYSYKGTDYDQEPFQFAERAKQLEIKENKRIKNIKKRQRRSQKKLASNLVQCLEGDCSYGNGKSKNSKEV
jgi:hypothetical protein